MQDLKRKCYSGSMPGIKRLWFVSVEEVASLTVTAEETVSVTLMSGCSWGEIEGRDTSATSTGGSSFDNRVQTTLPGWTTQDAVGIGRLTKGRYLLKWTDRAGDTWMCGYGEPMHLEVTESAPTRPTERQGITLSFSCQSEFGFLNMA